MFHLPVPVLEKVLRPILVYLCMIVLLRVFGKRELAQLNPFDLVVLLSLSNTVQNAIIGDDNSLSGGIIGAFSLLAANWTLNRILFRAPKLNDVLQGKETVLICDGVVDQKAMDREILTREELVGVLHKQNIRGLGDVKECTLEPGGTFYVESKEDSFPRARHEEILKKIDELMREVQQLKQTDAERTKALKA
ncbi:MAG: DUF421 domain-containing protein [Janthinobacterium lividum]